MFNWLQHFADWLIYSVFSIEIGSHLGDALNFFVYDTLKILILLFIIVFIMGIVISLLSGTNASDPVMYIIDGLGWSISGVILGFLYFSPIKKEFEK